MRVMWTKSRTSCLTGTGDCPKPSHGLSPIITEPSTAKPSERNARRWLAVTAASINTQSESHKAGPADHHGRSGSSHRARMAKSTTTGVKNSVQSAMPSSPAPLRPVPTSPTSPTSRRLNAGGLCAASGGSGPPLAALWAASVFFAHNATSSREGDRCKNGHSDHAAPAGDRRVERQPVVPARSTRPAKRPPAARRPRKKCEGRHNCRQGPVAPVAARTRFPPPAPAGSSRAASRTP